MRLLPSIVDRECQASLSVRQDLWLITCIDHFVLLSLIVIYLSSMKSYKLSHSSINSGKQATTSMACTAVAIASLSSKKRTTQ